MVMKAWDRPERPDRDWPWVQRRYEANASAGLGRLGGQLRADGALAGAIRDLIHYGICFKYKYKSYESDDISNDVMLLLIKKGDSYDDSLGIKIRTYCKKPCIWAVSREMRRMLRAPLVGGWEDSDEPFRDFIDDHAPSIDEVLGRAEKERLIVWALGELKQKHGPESISFKIGYAALIGNEKAAKVASRFNKTSKQVHVIKCRFTIAIRNIIANRGPPPGR